jgi:hypothetical protein
LSLKHKAEKPSRAIAVVFIVTGSSSLALSILFQMEILAFIGLGLTFFGAIFSFTRKANYVQESILDSTAKSAYSTLDRMINELSFNTHAYYLPAYPQNAHLPEYLVNLKKSVVFLTGENFSGKPAVDELVSGKFLSNKENGVFISSPGSDLLAYYENQFQNDISKFSVQDLCVILPRYVADCNLARQVELKILGNSSVSVQVSPILYKSLYSPKSGLKTVYSLGCPVVSSIACAFAKVSGKIVQIQKLKVSSDGLSVEGMLVFL